MFKWLKNWLSSKRLFHVDSPMLSVKSHSYVQENTRDREAVKRFIKSFEQQREQMQARAMVPHACSNPLECTKQKCFQWRPDTVVSETIVTKSDIDRDFGR